MTVIELVDQILVCRPANTWQWLDPLDQPIEILLKTTACAAGLNDIDVGDELGDGMCAAVQAFDMHAAHQPDLFAQRRFGTRAGGYFSSH